MNRRCFSVLRILPAVLMVCGIIACNDQFDSSADDEALRAALDPSKKPGQNFNLSTFKLQLPVASGDGVQEITQPTLATYSSSYFYTATDGAMVFWCPENGATTSGTSYPRSELRDLAEFGVSGTHTLTATCKVQKQPSTNQIIIGQIHGSSSGSEALKVRWNNGSVLAGYKTKMGATEVKTTIVSGLSLGSTINYTVQVVGHKVTVTVNGKSMSYTLDSSWDNEGLYFKAGSYVQAHTSSSTVGGQVAFYMLNGVPTGTTPTASPTVRPSATATAAPTATPVVWTSVSAGSWVTKAFTNQVGTFTVEFDATVSSASTDAVFGLSKAASTAYSGYACMVRFNPSGAIDARNAGGYTAQSTIRYTASTIYHFRMVVNVPAKTYSAYVTAPGGSEQTIGTNYAFRTEQNTVTSLSYWGISVNSSASGTEKIANFIKR